MDMKRREFIAECSNEDTFLFLFLFFFSFFSPSGITICLLLFPCTQLPVPLGHAEERRREEGEGEGEEEEEENQGGRYKKDSLTNINMACVCVVCVSVCLGVCFITVYVRHVQCVKCVHVKGCRGEEGVGHKEDRVGWGGGVVNNSTSSKSTLPSLAVFPRCKSQIDNSE